LLIEKEREMVKYTNAILTEAIYPMFTITNKQGEKVLDQVKFDAWKKEQEAQGSTFPTGKRGKVVDTKELKGVKDAIYKAIGTLPHVAVSGKKGYIIDDIDQLVEVQLLLRVVEADKAGVTKARFENIHKATSKAMNITTKPKKKK
tara:strand:+ start:441 stop:878 length:438 start_codon:yes stop_codon:yes gene_type:complete